MEIWESNERELSNNTGLWGVGYTRGWHMVLDTVLATLIDWLRFDMKDPNNMNKLI